MPKATSSPASSKPSAKRGKPATPTTKASATSTGLGQSSGTQKATRQAVDWQAVERDYRAGILSLREMSAAHGVSHVAIKKHAEKTGWSRDLSAKIKAKADELVNRAAVNKEVNAAGAVSEREVIESNALQIARVRGTQRSDITRGRSLCMSLLVELESQTGNLPELQALGEMLRAPDDTGADKLNDIYRAVISLPERTKTMKALADSLKTLIGLEREAYNIDATTPDAVKTLVDLAAIPPAERQAAYLKLVSGT